MNSPASTSNAKPQRNMALPLLVLALLMATATALDAWRGYTLDQQNGVNAALVAGLV